MSDRIKGLIEGLNNTNATVTGGIGFPDNVAESVVAPLHRQSHIDAQRIMPNASTDFV